MLYEASVTAVIIFAAFVASVVGFSFWLGRRGQSATGYYAAHGQVPWFVNGIAFAGDYLSAASFRTNPIPHSKEKTVPAYSPPEQLPSSEST